jgi:DNA-binding transcriptional regulator YdaS (Cro superfamily)
MSGANGRQPPQRTPKEALIAAVNMAGSQSKFARLLGVKGLKQGHVSGWLKTGKLPEKYAVIAEEKLGGRVTRYEFSPRLYEDPAVASSDAS